MSLQISFKQTLLLDDWTHGTPGFTPPACCVLVLYYLTLAGGRFQARKLLPGLSCLRHHDYLPRWFSFTDSLTLGLLHCNMQKACSHSSQWRYYVSARNEEKPKKENQPAISSFPKGKICLPFFPQLLQDRCGLGSTQNQKSLQVNPKLWGLQTKQYTLPKHRKGQTVPSPSVDATEYGAPGNTLLPPAPSSSPLHPLPGLLRKCYWDALASYSDPLYQNQKFWLLIGVTLCFFR